MDEKKKRKYDTVPEIYMSGTDKKGFFMPNYPVEDSGFSTTAVPDDDENDGFGDRRTEFLL